MRDEEYDEAAVACDSSFGIMSRLGSAWLVVVVGVGGRSDGGERTGVFKAEQASSERGDVIGKGEARSLSWKFRE